MPGPWRAARHDPGRSGGLHRARGDPAPPPASPPCRPPRACRCSRPSTTPGTTNAGRIGIGMKTLYDAGFDPHGHGELLPEAGGGVPLRQQAAPEMLLTTPRPRPGSARPCPLPGSYGRAPLAPNLDFWLAKGAHPGALWHRTPRAAHLLRQPPAEGDYPVKDAAIYGRRWPCCSSNAPTGPTP